MGTIAVAIVCKTPTPGFSKTRLSPPLRPDECAQVSACFIEDLSRTIGELGQAPDATACALYTPIGSEDLLKPLLPDNFVLVPQREGDFGARLLAGTKDILALGYDGVILVNSDSPTIPKSLLRQAVDSVKRGDRVTLSRAFDGGYTLIGLSRPHEHIFYDIPWSTEQVYSVTKMRAVEMGLAVEDVPGWYDVDDAESYKMLEDELSGKRMPFMTEVVGELAPSTRAFVERRRVKMQIAINAS